MSPVFDLEEARVNRGLSLRAAAREIGVDWKTLRRAERGDHRPQARNAFRIARFYGLQVTDIWPLEPTEGAAA